MVNKLIVNFINIDLKALNEISRNFTAYFYYNIWLATKSHEACLLRQKHVANFFLKDVLKPCLFSLEFFFRFLI